MQRKPALPNILLILGAVVCAYFAICYLLARKYVRPGGHHCEPPDGFAQAEEIDAWISEPTPESRAVFVLVHGYGGAQAGWTDVANELQRRGFGVVIPALPGHANTSKERSGFAIKESQIVADAVAWVRNEMGTDSKVVLVGISMGGAACWLATEKDPSVTAVVSEGSFARLGPATRRWMNRKAPWASVALYPVTLMARRMSGVDPSKVNPVEAAARWSGRSLVIHGDADALFSLDEARELAEAAGGDLWIVEGAGHAHCSTVDVISYVDRIASLVE
jgi:uncharacterized protein